MAKKIERDEFKEAEGKLTMSLFCILNLLQVQVLVESETLGSESNGSAKTRALVESLLRMN